MAKNRLVYGMVLLTLLIFILLRPLPMTYWALYAVLLAPLFSLLLALVSQRGFCVSSKLCSNYVERGMCAPYQITVKNPSLLPYSCVCVHYKISAVAPLFTCEEFYFSISARKSGSVTVHVSADYRGSYPVAPSALFFYDFLGLFRWKKRLPPPLCLIVVPKVHVLPGLPLNTENQDTAVVKTQTPHDDYSAISDLRKYQPPDSYRKIHWKASAKRNELISKHFQETEAQTVFLCIDTSTIQAPRRDALILEDQMMDALVSVMDHCTKLGYSAVLDHMGVHKPEPVAEFSQLFQTAVHLAFDARGDFDTYLTRFLHAHRGHGNLILFLQDISVHTVSALQSKRAPGQNLIVFHFGKIEDTLMEKLQEFGIPCIDFCSVVQL